MKATITFDDQGGITIEGDDEAVKRAYEIWNPFNVDRLNTRAALTAQQPSSPDRELLEALRLALDVVRAYESEYPRFNDALAKGEAAIAAHEETRK